MVFLDVFGEVPDPRDLTAQHPLPEILFVALAAVLCGATHCTEMELFAKNRLDLLRQFIPLERGAPSHDTFSRVLAALDPVALNEAFMRFMAAFGAQARIDAPTGQVAIDGKSLRRAYAKGRSHMPPLVVTAFGCDTFMSLAQTVAQEGGEVQAAIAALELLSLKGLTVTADALHCHRRMTKTVREGGGHYVIAIKGNQSKLATEANAALDKAAASKATKFHQTEEEAHGRHEVRRAFVIPFAQTPGKNALVDLCAIGRVESWRTVKGKTTHKVRCYALSRKMPARELLATVRRHWSIENDLHWQLDVLLGEDQLRGRKNNSAANHAILRRLTLNVLRADPENIPLSHKRLKARWADQDLLRLFTHMR
ncbi:ISAs1 family transposase [Mesorhizobium sp. WSM4906]|uniref:ISAs1 family transposase n=1 Tax=Mesorhizobium sp. WSM4906 TaxID=3038546 RepID=UPI002416E36B|nr:ISAs1 family transposase [Mesorhizobium sp. WSM4906]WFP75965.1 ISAs1 family transposase [Mesorhizobium sp. WSM4906]WFP78513.1 ISAs1 family transposase [Mesorhizobium sp. WSM4906]